MEGTLKLQSTICEGKLIHQKKTEIAFTTNRIKRLYKQRLHMNETENASKVKYELRHKQSGV